MNIDTEIEYSTNQSFEPTLEGTNFLAPQSKSNDRPNFITTSGEEVLYDLLFSDSLKKQYIPAHKRTGSYNYNNNQSSFEDSLLYLQELNSFHLDRLQAEPQILFENKQQIQEEIKNLAFSNYKTFIRTAQCSREIYSDFSIIDSRLDQLITKLPEFTSSCENFTKNIQSINGARRSNNLTLQKHNQLLEILEISQLMDTCVRNEYYEEALDLAAYVKRLDKKFSSSIPIIQQITEDCNKSLNLMLKQLLQQLKTSLQFNQCLKIIGIIRRLDVFTESELRFKFLQLRDSWLHSLIQSIPQADTYHHISKTIEEFRIHLFDIITQYRAIFSDDDSSAPSTAPEKYTILSGNQKDLNESKLFYYWLQHKIRNFLFILRKDLALGVGNRLDSVLSQAMYFGLAFSRVGLDFRALMVPLFEEVILEQLKKALSSGNCKFEESLAKLNWSELYLESSKSLNATLQQSMDYAFENNKGKGGSGGSIGQSSIVNPPIQLLEYQPLAIYLNCVLHHFNELRLCAPLNLYSKVFSEMRGSIKKLAIFIDGYYKKEKLDKNESELFSNFLYHLCYLLVPYLERCLNILLPIEQLQKVYSIAQGDLEKFKENLRLDAKDLLNPICDLIPTIKFEESRQTLGTVDLKGENLAVTTEPSELELIDEKKEVDAETVENQVTTESTPVENNEPTGEDLTQDKTVLADETNLHPQAES